MPTAVLLIALLGATPSASYFSSAGTHGAHARRAAAAVGMSEREVPPVPVELAEAQWLPEVVACCALASAAGKVGESEERMGAVLTWLQTMLVELELGKTEELDGTEEDELDGNFVSAARPWLHTKAFFDVPAQDFAEELWEHVGSADYLLPDGSGGSLLLLLPSGLPFSLFSQVRHATFRAQTGAP